MRNLPLPMRRVPHGLSVPDAAQPFLGGDLAKMDDHFGEDAAISKDDLDEIRNFLTSHAADSPDATPRERHYLSALLPSSTPLRITAMPWWNQMHADFNFEGAKHSQVKSAANCLACHNNTIVR